ncbi:conserved Plasmodium protein, unknown function [Plasmodium gallinaceum]|uniref:Uncharacterized protein n=1 Tax=Plasmodium gallinaceum TaxID=5849 RepID=A0A1J1GT43_PLAGA|nr:conserved Plasmodium protein, unknown function [Plasmodium gallinaceum]CRG94219.1 conserved Plasmodium protein, unknown function [Plasmodium gallinaceum]
MGRHNDKYSCNHRGKSHIKSKKKKEKKSKNNIYVLLFFFSISLILYLNSEKVADFVENFKKNPEISTLSTSTSYTYPMNNGITKKEDDDLIRTFKIATNEEIRNNLLMDTFNIKKFEDDTYKLKFYGDDLINNIEIIKKSNFIFDAINYLIKGMKGSNLYSVNQRDKGSLRNEKEKRYDAGKLKRLIIIKLLKCISVLVFIYIIYRLITLLFKNVINFIFVLIFKIIKYCCCGGK